MRHDKTKKQLEKELHDLNLKYDALIEMVKNVTTERDHAKANQKPEPKNFLITLSGNQGTVGPHIFNVEGISSHDALFLIEHATANLRQAIRIA